MKQFLVILKFELSSYFKNKVFVGITVALVLASAILLSFPRVTALFSADNGQSALPKTEQTFLINSDDTAFAFLQQSLAAQGIKAEKTELGEEALKEAVHSEQCDGAAVITGPTSFTSIVKDITMFDSNTETLRTVLADYYKNTRLLELGANPQQARDILEPPIESNVIQTGKNQMDTFFFTYILIFALYMAILLYGQLVTTSVATEKSSRAMELLITSAKPTSLMFGKVIGSGLAGLMQLFLVLGSAMFFFNLNKSLWGDNQIINSIFAIPPSLLGFMLLFFVLGFFIYAFLFGAIGSLASKLEDVNTLIMPVVLVFVAAFLVVMMSMSSGNIDSPLMVVCSYIPLTSPMAMFTRIAMGNVAAYEIIISVAILFLSTIGIGYLTAKIYRMGVLMYGNRPKLSTIIKNLNK